MDERPQETPEETLARLELESSTSHQPAARQTGWYATGFYGPPKPTVQRSKAVTTAMVSFVAMLMMAAIFLGCALLSSLDAHRYIGADYSATAEVVRCERPFDEYECQIRWRNDQGRWQEGVIRTGSVRPEKRVDIIVKNGVAREAPDLYLGVCCAVPGLVLGFIGALGLWISVRRSREITAAWYRT